MFRTRATTKGNHHDHRLLPLKTVFIEADTVRCFAHIISALTAIFGLRRSQARRCQYRFWSLRHMPKCNTSSQVLMPSRNRTFRGEWPGAQYQIPLRMIFYLELTAVMQEPGFWLAQAKHTDGLHCLHASQPSPTKPPVKGAANRSDLDPISHAQSKTPKHYPRFRNFTRPVTITLNSVLGCPTATR